MEFVLCVLGANPENLSGRSIDLRDPAVAIHDHESLAETVENSTR